MEILKEVTGFTPDREVGGGDLQRLARQFQKGHQERTFVGHEKRTGIQISPLVNMKQEDEGVGSSRSFENPPQLECFKSAQKNAIYYSTVKVFLQDSLRFVEARLPREGQVEEPV